MAALPRPARAPRARLWQVDPTSNLLVAVPGGNDGPGGVLVRLRAVEAGLPQPWVSWIMSSRSPGAQAGQLLPARLHDGQLRQHRGDRSVGVECRLLRGLQRYERRCEMREGDARCGAEWLRGRT